MQPRNIEKWDCNSLQTNDPILIYQNNHVISAKFVEEDDKMIVVNLRETGKVAFEKGTCRIELDYQERLLKFIDHSPEDNNYFKRIYDMLLDDYRK